MSRTGSAENLNNLIKPPLRMNILTGLHYNEENSSTVTVFYTYFSTSTDPQEIVKNPAAGSRKCEMFKRGFVSNIKLFENGMTFVFKNQSTNFSPYSKKNFRGFKIHLHPQRLKNQIYTLADLVTDCGLSGLRVIQFFDKILGEIKLDEFKKTG